MEPEIYEWLQSLSSEEQVDKMLVNSGPHDGENEETSDYWIGWGDGQTVLAHRILCVLGRIESEKSR